MNIIADTNVWYDLANGYYLPSVLTTHNNLYATPIAIFEITSKLSEHTFEQRQLTADALLKYAYGFVDDPELHLARIWGYPIEDRAMNWHDALKIIVKSKNIDDMFNGIMDYEKKVQYNIDIPLVEKNGKGFIQRVVLI